MSEFKNGMVMQSMDERRQEARGRCATAIAAAVDAELNRLILPSDRLAVIDDAMAFTVFLLVTKKLDVLRIEPTKGRLIVTWNDAAKMLARALPESLLEYAKESNHD